MIKDDPVFANNSYNPQDPISYQLLLALCRFGGYGNKSSYVDIAVKLGVSGTFRRPLQLIIATTYQSCAFSRKCR
jgi:hypothetical protein